MLWISPGTVRKHLENAYEKLDVHTRTGAVAALFTRPDAKRLTAAAPRLLAADGDPRTNR